MRIHRRGYLHWTSLALLLAGIVFALPACNKEADEAAVEEDTSEIAAVPGPPLDTSTLPVIVASVDGEEVAKEILLQQAAGRRTQMIQRGAPQVSEDATFYRDVLDQIVGGMLLYKEAGKQGLEASDTEIDGQVQAIRGGFPDEESFVAALTSQGTSPEQLADSIRQELSIRQLIDTTIMTQIEVTDEQKQAFYEENMDRMQHPEQVRVRHILIGLPEEPTPEAKAEALTKASDLRQQIQDGGDFAELAKEHSTDTNSARLGGELPWLAPGQTVPPFEKTAYSLADGELSQPVETPFGYHVIELLERKEAGVLPFEQVQPRIDQVLQEQQLRERLDALVEDLRGQAEVEIFM